MQTSVCDGNMQTSVCDGNMQTNGIAAEMRPICGGKLRIDVWISAGREDAACGW